MVQADALRRIAAIAAKDRANREMFDPSLAVAPHVYARAQEHGVIVRAIGMDVLAFSPPLIITGEQLDQVVERFGKALDETHAWLQDQGVM